VIYLLAFVVLVLAVARATRVIVIDEVAAPLRNWVLRKWPVPSKPSKLIRCYWCTGFWVSLVLATYTQAIFCFTGWLPYQTLALLPITTLAVAYAAAWVLDKEEAANGA
jgi:hypothetical protein